MLGVDVDVSVKNILYWFVGGKLISEPLGQKEFEPQ